MKAKADVPIPAIIQVDGKADISARIERLPITRPVFWTRNVIGAATFFDGYTVIAIAYAMPVLVQQWSLNPQQIGLILSMGYLGQVIGAVLFGSLAERFGRLKILLCTILLFVSMDIACLFAWGALSMMLFRFVQGIGTGGEVPVASAYINEFVSSKGRGRFFLLYEVMFLLGLVGAGLIGSALVPRFGWQAMFAVGLIPAAILIPLRFFMKESPRWLAGRGRYHEADSIVSNLERSAIASGHVLADPQPASGAPTKSVTDWRELFQEIYRRRTLTIWGMWFSSYLVANGIITWLPTLYRQTFNLPLETSLRYGLLTSVAGVIAAVACALLIDRVGRKRWYVTAFLLAPIPLASLAMLGATNATQVLILAGLAYAIVQTITFSLYLYSAELYPTRLRAMGTGFGSAWLRLGSSAGPIVVGWIIASFGIQYVFGVFACVLLAGATITALGGIETKGRALEELSP
ncbi:MFS transporter [Bradyrhizobium liaoningense]|uniref:MFS transporter n=1 Tax=Bradyrhizobium liaoningense TaxID=43992 RepID=UPI001BA7688D|nr:MFS transporter [Bradyrhizobium liaoningense]MBR0713173.1 MFS transporter [Bradyrhizobium liaoningense]